MAVRTSFITWASSCDAVLGSGSMHPASSRVHVSASYSFWHTYLISFHDTVTHRCPSIDKIHRKGFLQIGRQEKIDATAVDGPECTVPEYFDVSLERRPAASGYQSLAPPTGISEFSPVDRFGTRPNSIPA